MAPRARAYEIAAFASAMVGDENETRKYANLARRYWRVLAGRDSFEAKSMDELRTDPRGHPSWRANLQVGKDEIIEEQEKLREGAQSGE